MIKFTKNLFTGHNPKIFSWDNPTHRVFNGEVVKGRKTKGYGTAVFEYAGKKYEPEPLNYFMKKVLQKRMLIKL